jgi:hypothetical protein
MEVIYCYKNQIVGKALFNAVLARMDAGPIETVVYESENYSDYAVFKSMFRNRITRKVQKYYVGIALYNKNTPSNEYLFESRIASVEDAPPSEQIKYVIGLSTSRKNEKGHIEEINPRWFIESTENI